MTEPTIICPNCKTGIKIIQVTKTEQLFTIRWCLA